VVQGAEVDREGVADAEVLVDGAVEEEERGWVLSLRCDIFEKSRLWKVN